MEVFISTVPGTRTRYSTLTAESFYVSVHATDRIGMTIIIEYQSVVMRIKDLAENQ
jgi:hypothetical protein